MFRRALWLVFLISIFAFPCFADGGKVEPVGAFSDQSAPEPVRKALEAKGNRVTLAEGSAICEVWLRTGVPSGNKSETQGALYTGMPISTMIGVISFSKSTNDYRGQTIKAGAYTLRYALHPVDGNHLGISPIRDFLVLVPVSADPNPETEYKFEELMKMSMKASGTNHPAVFSLASPDAGASAPSVVVDDMNRVIFISKLKTQSGSEMPIAFIVKGRAEQ